MHFRRPWLSLAVARYVALGGCVAHQACSAGDKKVGENKGKDVWTGMPPIPRCRPTSSSRASTFRALPKIRLSGHRSGQRPVPGLDPGRWLARRLGRQEQELDARLSSTATG